MRLRSQGEEANEDPEEPGSVDTEGPNMYKERTLQSREVHGVADEERKDGAPKTGVPEQQGGGT